MDYNNFYRNNFFLVYSYLIHLKCNLIANDQKNFPYQANFLKLFFFIIKFFKKYYKLPSKGQWYINYYSSDVYSSNKIHIEYNNVFYFENTLKVKRYLDIFLTNTNIFGVNIKI